MTEPPLLRVRCPSCGIDTPMHAHLIDVPLEAFAEFSWDCWKCEARGDDGRDTIVVAFPLPPIGAALGQYWVTG